MITELTKIANKHNTDKGTVAYEAHGYTEEYSKYIPNTGNYTLLEIGIYHADSLYMWEEYNPDLNIHGIDIDHNCLLYYKYHNKLKFHIGDATHPSFIEDVLFDSGIPDFIIDDGSHNYNDILDSFKLLFPRLNKKGLYFIEDLHANHAQKNKLIQNICKWLYSENIEYNNLGLFCKEKLWILEK